MSKGKQQMSGAVENAREPKAQRRPLRLWPGVAIVLLQWLGWFVIPILIPDATYYGLMGGLMCGLAVVVWWMFFSRAPWIERLGALVLMIVALAATPLILHKSIATGAMGMLFYIYAIPVLSLAFVAWAVLTRSFSDGLRRATMLATILIACGGWALVRTGGFTGEGDSDLAWRWAKTPEQRLLAIAENVPTVPQPASASMKTPDQPGAAVEAPEQQHIANANDAPLAQPPAPDVVEIKAAWPGFRGPDRNSIVRGVRIETDWAASPPVEVWRRLIGPGWSSFAVVGDRFYTQEQRGDEEIVACYNLTSGEPVWMHSDTARFWESNGGPGPRATPTLRHGRVYSFGATGILNVLDAGTGLRLWSRNVKADTDTQVPMWGFSSSPLVLDSLVIVAAAAELAAYDIATGEPRWFGPDSGQGYSSPHLLAFAGVNQVVLLRSSGAISVDPASGTVLWQHAWKGYPIVQPALTADGDLLLSVSDQSGIRRLGVANGDGNWRIEERWTSRGLKPYFNDFVVHQGHAYGFDGSILSCIELGAGKRMWKGGRYGHGQLLLLADQDVLLVLSEQGELVLVAAVPDGFTELARVPAISGKTWNHPVLVGNVLLVRNGQEMVAFRLALAGV